MQTRPARWASLWDADGTWMELRLTLDNVQYGNDHIAAGGASVTHYLYDSYSIGNACAGRLAVKLLEPQSIARGIREAKLECRLVSEDGQTASGWLAQGTWYLDKVEYNADGSARLELYDALALTDVYLYDRGAVPASAGWPKTATAAVQLVCDRCGVPRPASYTAFSSVQVPAPEGLTCREVLQSIAAVAGGNFTMGKDGRLRFVPLKGLGAFADSAFTMGVADYSRTSGRRAVTGLLLKGYDDSYSYGSDSFEVPGECAWADSTVGNAAYYAIRALQYQGYKATGCYVDPLAELGDQAAIEDSSECMLLDDFSLTYGEGLWGSCSAPLRDEVEERIKRANASERKVNRLALRTQANSAAIDTMATSEYVSELLDRMNAQANAQGGYTYITQGEGIRTYDVPVSDPLVGAEASFVTEVKGGTIRIANSRNDDGTWKWLTVFESGHIASELVTAVNIVAGFIGSPSGNYWNLDTGEMRLASTSTVDGQALSRVVEQAAETSGSVNLLVDTNVPSLTRSAADADRYWSQPGNAKGRNINNITSLSDTETPNAGIKYATQLIFPSGLNGAKSGICFYEDSSVRMVDGQKYTASCWARTTSGSGSIIMQYGQTSYVASEAIQVSNLWRRYSWTFTFRQSSAGGSWGARFYFYGSPTSANATTFLLCGMKLEIGGKATDWSPAEQDSRYEITKATKALDASLNQEKVAKRLFTKPNGKTVQGIVLNNGELYINGAYISGKTLSGSTIFGGIITDKQDKQNTWNLNTGLLRTRNLNMQDGYISGRIKLAKDKNRKADYIEMRPSGIKVFGKSSKVGMLIYPESNKSGSMLTLNIKPESFSNGKMFRLDLGYTGVYTRGTFKSKKAYRYSTGNGFSRVQKNLNTNVGGAGVTTIVPYIRDIECTYSGKKLISVKKITYGALHFANGILVKVT